MRELAGGQDKDRIQGQSWGQEKSYPKERACGDKDRLRRALRDRLSALDPSYRSMADERIVKYALELEAYRNANTIFCYVGIRQEIQTFPILNAMLEQGKRVAVPRCIGAGVMEAREIRSLSQLKPGAYGIPEPGRDLPVVSPKEIDLAFVPCLSCNGRGVRLGQGGGYYDRYLSECRALRAALCREKMVWEEIPWERHDILMDMRITEKGIRHFAKKYMSLRPYEPRDLSDIVQLFYDTVHTVNRRDYTEKQLEAWADGQIDLSAWNQSFLAHDTVVAVIDGQIVGFGDMDADGYLDRLYVHRDFQGMGVASSICDHLEGRSGGRKFFVHSSITARPFFEKRGYQVIKEQQVERKGQLLTNFVMECRKI